MTSPKLAVVNDYPCEKFSASPACDCRHCKALWPIGGGWSPLNWTEEQLVPGYKPRKPDPDANLYAFKLRKHRLWTFTQDPKKGVVDKEELHAIVVDVLKHGLRPDWYVIALEQTKRGIWHAHVVCAYPYGEKGSEVRYTYAKYKSNWLTHYNQAYDERGHIDSKVLKEPADVSKALLYIMKDGIWSCSDTWCGEVVLWFLNRKYEC